MKKIISGAVVMCICMLVTACSKVKDVSVNKEMEILC